LNSEKQAENYEKLVIKVPQALSKGYSKQKWTHMVSKKNLFVLGFYEHSESLYGKNRSCLLH
jgi:hypothetical protein